MKRRILGLILVFATVLSMTACIAEPAKEVDGQGLLQSLLTQVEFADTLVRRDNAELFFENLPEGVTVELHNSSSGRYADELILITLNNASDAEAVRESVDKRLGQVRSQFANYNPIDVAKIDKAVIWSQGKYLIVCITDDYADAKKILDHANDLSYRLPEGSTSKPNGDNNTSNPGGNSSISDTSNPGGDSSITDTSDTAGTSSSATQNNVTTSSGAPENSTVQTRPDGYPVINSTSGTYSVKAGGIILQVDKSGFETYGFSDSVTTNYAKLVNKVADALKGETKVYSLLIPTAIGIVFPDNVAYDVPNQGRDIEKVLAKLSDDIVGVNCYDNLMKHRNEYLYFHSDHHWNGLGAYYAYEAFCGAKGVTPYILAQRQEVTRENYKGSLYDRVPTLQPDTIYAYKPYSTQATMKFYETKAAIKNDKAINWKIISDSKTYSLFAGADQPLAIFTNPQVTDGSVAVVVKESFGNALLPYLVDHYTTIYEIDYRYWGDESVNNDLATFVKKVGADDLIFANNMGMVNTGSMVGLLSNIIH